MTTTDLTKTCPSCDAALVHVDRSGIAIDACPRCRGVWLDRGELDRLIERERSGGGGDVDPDFLAEVQGRGGGRVDDEDDRRRGGKRRRGSFLEELFELGG